MIIVKRLNSLNGWQRLWLSISLIGTLWWAGNGYFYGYKSAEIYKPDQNAIIAFRLPQCRWILDLPPGGSVDGEPPYSECVDLYVYKRNLLGEATTAGDYINDMEDRRRSIVFEWIMARLVLWVPAMIALYIGGMIFAWIRSGFRDTR